MRRIVSLIASRIYAVGRLNMLLVYRNYSRSSSNLVWIYPSGSIFRFWNYLVKSNTFFHDLALVSELARIDGRFRIVIGKRAKFKCGDVVHYTISDFFDSKTSSNYSQEIILKIQELENKGCIPCPGLNEVKLWENKSWMHKEFDRLSINHPRTEIRKKLISETSFSFPFLIKEVHSSGSKGVYEVKNVDDIKKYKTVKNDDNPVLYQELLQMRKDLRVILVNGRIFLHYWRINQSENWRPTSTSHGSKVDFDFFPEKWRNQIISDFMKFRCASGAFDIAWQNDDLESQPYILEFSPFFMPNPRPSDKFANRPYSDYKRTLFSKEPYFKSYVDSIYLIKHETLQYYLNGKS